VFVGMPACILVVEDEARVREAVSHLLEIEGYGVVEASDGGQALRVLRGPDRVDLVLLDLMMPGTDGWAVLAERARDPALRSVPVVVMSAVPLRGKPDGTVAYLRKPVDPDVLLDTISQSVR
jgi:CheY-like chemotaxis protein